MKIKAALLALLILLPTSVLSLEVDSVLRSRLESGETVNAWVFLADRGGPQPLEGALEIVTARALARRAKVLPPERLLSERDLPLAEAHLQWFIDRGFQLRAESRWMNALSLRLDRAGLALLESAPFIRRIEAVRRSAARLQPDLSSSSSYDRGGSMEDPIDYGGTAAELAQINVPAVHQTGNHGEGVIVGMLDTGFFTDHEVFEELTVLGAWDFINDDGIVENESGDPENQHNHGTITLSSLAGYEPGSHVGVAFGASFYLAKTEDTSQEVPAEEDFWVEGIEWLEAQGCDLVSSSLGYDDWYTFDDLDGNTCVTTIAGDYAVELGMSVINSAGNNRTSTGTMNAPADGDSVISVGAVNVEGEIAYFSSPGPTADGRIKPDICADGVSNHVAMPGTWDEYTEASGTSLSCPLAAGVAALVMSANPDLTPWELREALRETADRADDPDNDYGWGILDALAATMHGQATSSGEDPAAKLSLRAWPNPFNPETRLNFTLDRGGWASLIIHDLSGRRVATLADGPFEAGEFERVWNGLDDSGAVQASGVYFARLRADRGTRLEKLVLIK